MTMSNFCTKRICKLNTKEEIIDIVARSAKKLDRAIKGWHNFVWWRTINQGDEDNNVIRQLQVKKPCAAAWRLDDADPFKRGFQVDGDIEGVKWLGIVPFLNGCWTDEILTRRREDEKTPNN